MGYKYYSDEDRKTLVNNYLQGTMGIYKYCRKYGLHARSLYRWIDNYSKSTTRSWVRENFSNCSFSVVEKCDAINLRLSGATLKNISEHIGCTVKCVGNWYNIYKRQGVYYLMGKNDFSKANIKKLKDKKYIKELEQKIELLQMEIDAHKVVGEILGKCPSLNLMPCLKTIPNRIKAQAINKLRLKYQKRGSFVQLRKIFDISKTTYMDNCASSNYVDKYLDVKKKIAKIFIESGSCYGHRRIYYALESKKVSISINTVLMLMRQMQIKPLQKKMRKFNSYKNDGNLPAKNWLYDSKTKRHFFNPERPWEIIGTDVTEFHLNGYKIYLSLMVDFYDSKIVSWSISKHPDMELVMASFNDLKNKAGENRFILHSDQGSCYRSPKWKNACLDNKILQSMSRKGRSGDNAPVEGVNGKIKTEFFHKRDFSGLSPKQFMKKLDKYLNWYNNERISVKLKGKTIKESREELRLSLSA